MRTQLNTKVTVFHPNLSMLDREFDLELEEPFDSINLEAGREPVYFMDHGRLPS